MEGNGGFPEYFKVNTQRNVHFLHFFRKERYSASGQTKSKVANKKYHRPQIYISNKVNDLWNRISVKSEEIYNDIIFLP